MEAVSLIHLVLRWLLVPIEAGAMLWLAGLSVSLLAWATWVTCRLCAGIGKLVLRQVTVQPGPVVSRQRSGRDGRGSAGRQQHDAGQSRRRKVSIQGRATFRFQALRGWHRTSS